MRKMVTIDMTPIVGTYTSAEMAAVKKKMDDMATAAVIQQFEFDKELIERYFKTKCFSESKERALHSDFLDFLNFIDHEQ